MKSVNKYEKIYPTVRFHLLIAKKKRRIVVQLLTQIYFFSRIFPYDTTHLTIRATYFAEQMQHRQIRLYAGFRAELQFYSTPRIKI